MSFSFLGLYVFTISSSCYLTVDEWCVYFNDRSETVKEVDSRGKGGNDFIKFRSGSMVR